MELSTTDDKQRGYQAAQAGLVSYRHGRYWIDDNDGAELARPDVVRGILAYRTSPEYFTQVDRKNEQSYRSLAQDCIDSAQTYVEPFKSWALKDAELFNEHANFYAQRAASR